MAALSSSERLTADVVHVIPGTCTRRHDIHSVRETCWAWRRQRGEGRWRCSGNLPETTFALHAEGGRFRGARPTSGMQVSELAIELDNETAGEMPASDMMNDSVKIDLAPAL